jgi:hypothetical protein
VHLYLQTVRTGSHGGDHHRLYQIGLAGGVAGVYHDGQMGLFVDDGHSGKIQRVAGVLFKGADAALAEDDLLVAACHDVLGAHDPLLDGVAQAALEQHGFVHLAHGLEQLEVLHVAGTDLHHVHILLKLRDAVLAHQLGHDGQAGGLAGLDHVQDALGLQTLEGVGRGTGLVGTAAEQGRAAGLDALCDAQSLLGTLDAAGACHDGDLFLAADLHAAAVNDRIGGVEQAVGALVRGRHAGDVVDPGVGQHVPLVDLGGVAHQTEHVVVLAGDQGHVQTLMLELVNDLFQFFLRGAFLGGDDHGLWFLSGFRKPSPSSLRDATSPEGGGFIACPGQNSSPLGGAVAAGD